MNKNNIDIDKLPVGSASNAVVDGCIVLEGGAFRGSYTEGVLDALMENDINMRCVVGVSAGAMNGMSYMSRQIGRAIRITMKYRHNSRYMGAKALRADKGLIGFSFIFGDLFNLEWFDKDSFCSKDRQFVAVATNLVTGKAEYFDRDESDIIKAIEASAALPLVSKPVHINGTPYFDGGCACKVPYNWAIENGHKKIIVVRTRHASYRKDLSRKGKTLKLVSARYRKYPEFINSLSQTNREYNRQCDELEKLHTDGEVYVISPSENVNVDRFEGDLNILYNLYRLGYNDTINQLEKIKEYLKK